MRFIGSSRQLKLTAVVILADDADNYWRSSWWPLSARV